MQQVKKTTKEEKKQETQKTYVSPQLKESSSPLYSTSYSKQQYSLKTIFSSFLQGVKKIYTKKETKKPGTREEKRTTV